MKNTRSTILITDKAHLEKEIEKEIKLGGNHVDLNHLDVSEVNDFSFVFYFSMFNGDISKWNVENVTRMNCMFEHSSFTGDLTNWKPYYAYIKEIFSSAEITTKPYWAEYENPTEREKVIKEYIEKKSLEEKLCRDLKTITATNHKVKV